MKINSQLAGTKPLEKMIRILIATGFVKDGIPISAMLIAQSGAGKSKTLIRFENEHVLRCDDLTSAGLFDILASDKENKVKFIVIPDFNPVLSHKSSVSNLLIANLLSVTQDGTVSVNDGRAKKDMKHHPVGILTAITQEMHSRHARKWRELGVTRRIIPIHYTYSFKTIAAAQKMIRMNHVSLTQLVSFDVKLKEMEIAMPKKIASELEALSTVLAANFSQMAIRNRDGSLKEIVQGTPIYAMAPHLILRSIAKASALTRHSATCTNTDLEAAEDFCRFTSMENKVAL